MTVRGIRSNGDGGRTPETPDSRVGYRPFDVQPANENELHRPRTMSRPETISLGIIIVYLSK